MLALGAACKPVSLAAEQVARNESVSAVYVGSWALTSWQKPGGADQVRSSRLQVIRGTGVHRCRSNTQHKQSIERGNNPFWYNNSFLRSSYSEHRFTVR